MESDLKTPFRCVRGSPPSPGCGPRAPSSLVKRSWRRTSSVCAPRAMNSTVTSVSALGALAVPAPREFQPRRALHQPVAPDRAVHVAAAVMHLDRVAAAGSQFEHRHLHAIVVGGREPAAQRPRLGPRREDRFARVRERAPDFDREAGAAFRVRHGCSSTWGDLSQVAFEGIELPLPERAVMSDPLTHRFEAAGIEREPVATAMHGGARSTRRARARAGDARPPGSEISSGAASVPGVEGPWASRSSMERRPDRRAPRMWRRASGPVD